MVDRPNPSHHTNSSHSLNQREQENAAAARGSSDFISVIVSGDESSETWEDDVQDEVDKTPWLAAVSYIFSSVARIHFIIDKSLKISTY